MTDLKKQHMSRCKHYAPPALGAGGGLGAACDKGILYSSFGKMILEAPCFKPDAAPTCPMAEYPTEAEADAFILEVVEWGRRTGTARAAIVAFSKATGLTNSALKCPICGKVDGLAYNVAPNGHIHAACSTRDCVAWME